MSLTYPKLNVLLPVLGLELQDLQRIQGKKCKEYVEHNHKNNSRSGSNNFSEKNLSSYVILTVLRRLWLSGLKSRGLNKAPNGLHLWYLLHSAILRVSFFSHDKNRTPRFYSNKLCYSNKVAWGKDSSASGEREISEISPAEFRV